MRLKNMIDFAAGFFAVRKCAVCGKILVDEENGAFCASCEKKYAALKEEKCPDCGQTPAYCRCFAHGRKSDFKCLHLFFYDSDFSRRVIYSLKNSGKKRLAASLARELARLIFISKGSDDISSFAVTYVPRSGKNIRRYGFDQAKMMAKEISRELNIPLVCTLKRLGKSAQKKANAEKRAENAAKSYALVSSDIAGKNFIIVDDVVTSGSTLSACASLLFSAGADKIIAATAAKTAFSSLDSGKHL